MLKTLLLASLFALPAAAQPAAPTPPGPPPLTSRPAPACRATGDVLLEIDLGVPNTHSFSSWTVKLYDNGAVVRENFDKDGKLTSKVGPTCVPSTTLASLSKSLTAAPFTIKHAEFTCAAMSATWVDYRMHGKLVFSEKMCGPDYLDDASSKALHDASDLVMRMTAPDPITSSPGKPVK